MDLLSDVNCEEVRAAGMAAKDLFISYRLSFVFLYTLLIVNLNHHVKHHIAPRFEAYLHLSEHAKEQLWIRLLQLINGTIMAIPGYLSLLFHAGSGCNAAEFYVLYFGMFLVMVDTVELSQRWPLQRPLLIHHTAVIALGIGIADWKVIPPNPEDPMPWQLVLLLSNMGTIWISDYFHAVYRTSRSLTFIKAFKLFYAILSIMRLVSFLQFVVFSIEFFNDGRYGGLLLSCLVCLAFGYNAAKAVIFVYNLDVDRYYREHQALWKGKTL